MTTIIYTISWSYDGLIATSNFYQYLFLVIEVSDWVQNTLNEISTSYLVSKRHVKFKNMLKYTLN